MRLPQAICPGLFALFLAPLAAQSTGFWEGRPPLAMARQEVAAAELGGRLYVGGGLLPSIQATETVEVYDPATRQWSFAPEMPTTRHHFGMASAGGKLYAIGGYVQSFVPDARCYCFDPATQQWSAIADLPRPRGALVAVAIDDKIYAVGGVATGVAGDLDVYDPATDQWQSLAAMPTPREHLSAAVIQGQLYAAGGRGNGQLFATLERYDPATNTWQTLTPMPTARGGNGAAALDGKLIVVGGEGSTLPSGNFPQAEEYNPATDTWRSLRNMAVPLHGIYPVTIGDEILVAGGATRQGFQAVNVVLALRRLPTGIERYGISTPSCSGAIAADPNQPSFAGNSQFALQSAPGGPPSTTGAMLLAATPDLAGTAVLGMQLHVGLTPPVFAIPATTDAQGAGNVALPIPGGSAGARFYVQFLWVNNGGCGGLPGPLSATDALDITVVSGA